MRHVHREAFMKRVISRLSRPGAGAARVDPALAQGKPPLKLGGILDMSGLYADITGAGQRDGRENGGGGFRRRGAGPQDRDDRSRSSQQGRSCRQHRPRHARQSGRRDDLRRRRLGDGARRRRDRQGAQQDRHVQRPRIDPPHQRSLRPLHGALRLRHLLAGQRDRVWPR